MNKTIREWQIAAYENAFNKGFHPEAEEGKPVSAIQVSAWLALLHSEVSEALECVREHQMTTTLRERDGKPEGFGSELADVFIRLCDTAQACGVDLETEIKLKHEYNTHRANKHGGKAL